MSIPAVRQLFHFNPAQRLDNRLLMNVGMAARTFRGLRDNVIDVALLISNILKKPIERDLSVLVARLARRDCRLGAVELVARYRQIHKIGVVQVSDAISMLILHARK